MLPVLFLRSLVSRLRLTRRCGSRFESIHECLLNCLIILAFKKNQNEHMKTIQSSIDTFIFHCQIEKGLSEKTLEAYRADLRQFRLFLEKEQHPSNPEEINKDVLRQFLESISGWKPKTIKRKVASVKAMFNHLEFEDQIAINPFRKMRISIKEPRQLPTVLDQAEVKRIFNAAYKSRRSLSIEHTYSYAEAVRDIAVLELLFATGIRVSELCSLKGSSVNLKTGTIHVLGKGGKERIMQVFAKEPRRALVSYYELFQNQIESAGYFFVNRLGSQLSDQSVRFMVRKYARKAKIKKHVTPHTFRHTFATLLLEADVDIKYIQHFLGHSSINTTQIYTHVNKRKQKLILASKHPRGRFSLDDV